jgi:hypothetical protein
MAMHYFHLANGSVSLDDIGTDLPTLAAVEIEALRTARDMLNLGSTDGIWDGGAWKVWVTDQPNAAGRTVLSLEVLAARGDRLP